ncbi:Uncharacterized protein APZ42_006811 [Daphnia magna]|uniref:Uncharacterized protein n=1 Tax=Daphnia magna TaxID=35525 RepID=A0A164FP77_9CRUS|nr:Uncharacterized protein APZ42_006811 [Daphnia magna]
MNDAIILDDEAIVRKIGNLESNLQFVSKEIKYHNSCRKKFASAAKSAVKKREEEHQSKWVLNKSIRENAMQKIIAFLEEKIMKEEEVHRVKDITKHYRLLLSELGLDYNSICRVRKCEVLEKLISYFGDKVTVINHTVEGVGQIIFKSDLSVDKALLTTFDANISSDYKVKEVAFMLRNLILETPRNILPKNVNIRDLIAGEVKPPNLLQTFFESLVAGKLCFRL